MRITLIGAGNVATHLGKALQESGHEMVQVFSRTEESASALAKRLSCPFVTRYDEISKASDMYLFSVSDAVLGEVSQRVHSVIGNCDALFVHTAGSMPLDVLPSKRRGVFYPMQTFSKSREVDFSKVSIFVESPTDASLLQSLARAISPNVYMLNGEQRKRLHIAAVFACNFTNHMYALSADLLREADLPFSVMLPLIDETARKVHRLEPHQAQTGPAVRGDKNVMNVHLSMLSDPQQTLYRLISESISNGDEGSCISQVNQDQSATLFNVKEIQRDA